MYVACRDQHGPTLLSTIHDTQDRTHLRIKLMPQGMFAAERCPRCGAPFPDVRHPDARSSAYTSQQKVCARGESAVHASSPETARQAPAVYIFTEELLDKYPPLAHLGVDEKDFAELRVELLGQKMGGRLPSQEQLKNYECVEQYMMYNSYVGW